MIFRQFVHQQIAANCGQTISPRQGQPQWAARPEYPQSNICANFCWEIIQRAKICFRMSSSDEQWVSVHFTISPFSFSCNFSAPHSSSSSFLSLTIWSSPVEKPHRVWYRQSFLIWYLFALKVKSKYNSYVCMYVCMYVLYVLLNIHLLYVYYS